MQTQTQYLNLLSEVSKLEEDINKLRRSLDREIGKAHAIAQRGKQLQLDVLELRSQGENLDQSIDILSKFAESRQSLTIKKIEELVSYGLSTIFNRKLDFRIVSSMRGKLVAMDFVLVSEQDGQQVETSILDSRGGGISAVAGFLLRLILLILLKDRASQILILDESWAQVSDQYVPRLAEFVRGVVDKAGFQVILVTHDTTFMSYADITYEFSLVDGITKVREVS